LEFFSALQAAFDNLDALGTVERDLWALKQETSCLAYYLKFVPLVSTLGWTSNTVKITYFCRGLKENLKDLLVGRDMPLDFSSYANKCISLDNDLFTRQKEKKRIQPLVLAPNPPTIRPTTPVLPPGPMELDSTQRKAYRRANNLCTYCGQPGYFVRDCPHPGRKKFSSISYAFAASIASASSTSLAPVLTPFSTPSATPISSALIPYSMGKESG
jgi:hypothetical protein